MSAETAAELAQRTQPALPSGKLNVQSWTVSVSGLRETHSCATAGRAGHVCALLPTRRDEADYQMRALRSQLPLEGNCIPW